MDLFTVVGLVIGIGGFITAYQLQERLEKTQGNLERIQRDLEKTQKDNYQLNRDKQQLERRIPEIKTHTVLMDGISGSGKSTFIARLMSPVSTVKELSKMTRTIAEYQTIDIPICWEGSSKTILHSLKFFDVSGEHPNSFIDALHTLSKQHSREEADVVLVIMWDISEEKWLENFEYLNKYRIKATYGSKMAKSIICSIIIFFNKIDRLDEDTAKQRLDLCESKINELFRDAFEVGYGEIHYKSGSVTEGTHVHDCLGTILQRFGLAPNFSITTGNAS